MNTYTLVVCGGTFDRLHAGHMAFLDSIFELSDHVVIGLTSDKYVNSFKPHSNILLYEERQNELEKFLKERGYDGRFEISLIDDVYGRAIDTKYAFEAIVVTESTQRGAEEINKKRREQGMVELPIVTIPLLSIDSGIPLSSTLIRSGKVGRQGQFFPNPTWSKNILFLPHTVRQILHQPFGTLYKEIPFDTLSSIEKIISVGDETTKKFLEKGITPKLSIIDFVVERKKLFEKAEDIGFSGKEITYKANNPPGSLTPEVWESLGEVDKRLEEEQNFIVEIEGEEDLLVIPLVLLLPLGYTIFYGQPHEGVVMLEVTEEIKQHVFSLLTQFTQSV